MRASMAFTGVVSLACVAVAMAPVGGEQATRDARRGPVMAAESARSEEHLGDSMPYRSELEALAGHDHTPVSASRRRNDPHGGL